MPLKSLPQVLGKALLRPPGPGVPDVFLGRVTCSRLWEAALGAAQLCGVSHTKGVLLPRVYGEIALFLRLELRGPDAWQATPSSAVCRHACQRLWPWLRMMFAMFPDAAQQGSDQWPWGKALPLAQRVGWVAPLRPTLGVWFVAPCPSAALAACLCAVSRASWRLLTGVHALYVPCGVSMATRRLFTGARAVCGMHVLFVAS